MKKGRGKQEKEEKTEEERKKTDISFNSFYLAGDDFFNTTLFSYIQTYIDN